MIDLDRFKQINDTYGHAAGDGFLQAVAAVLTADVRECDVVARIGGDEFTVLMTDLDGGNCAARAQALSNRLNGHAVDWHGTVLPRSEEHTSELQSLMRISYAVFCLKKKKKH